MKILVNDTLKPKDNIKFRLVLVCEMEKPDYQTSAVTTKDAHFGTTYAIKLGTENVYED